MRKGDVCVGYIAAVSRTQIFRNIYLPQDAPNLTQSALRVKCLARYPLRTDRLRGGVPWLSVFTPRCEGVKLIQRWCDACEHWGVTGVNQV